jgi:hypothetical protein
MAAELNRAAITALMKRLYMPAILPRGEVSPFLTLTWPIRFTGMAADWLFILTVSYSPASTLAPVQSDQPNAGRGVRRPGAEELQQLRVRAVAALFH